MNEPFDWPVGRRVRVRVCMCEISTSLNGETQKQLNECEKQDGATHGRLVQSLVSL